MFQIDVLSRTPVYEQIVNQLERLVLGNILPPGCQLPSVRNLSVELSINPNTIQKAYAELERRGLSVSVPGKGSFVREDLGVIRRLYQDEQKDRLRTLLMELRSYEFDREMVLSCVDEIFPPVTVSSSCADEVLASESILAGQPDQKGVNHDTN